MLTPVGLSLKDFMYVNLLNPHKTKARINLIRNPGIMELLFLVEMHSA